MAKTKESKKLSPRQTKSFLLKLLKGGILNVKFRKINGDMRTMKASLKPDVMRKYGFNRQVFTRYTEPNPDVCWVWDLEKQDWRAFRIDSLVSIKTVERLRIRKK